MTTRRRLSIEPLEDRTTPASASDLSAVAQQTITTALVLQEMSKDPMAMASPAIRPAVESYFTAVYQNAILTTQLLGQFPGTLPAGQAAAAGMLATVEANIAQSVAARLGFNLTPPAATSPPPTPTPTPTPGTISPAKSTVAVSPASVPVGSTSTITLTAKDANGTALTKGGSVVAFALGAGTTVGTIGNVTDVGNGTYTATFTATTAGSNTITATIGGQTVTTTAPTITVTGAGTGTGNASLARSNVTVSPASIANGGTSTVRLTARDASGTPLTTGGLNVAFGLGTGTATGNFGAVTDNGDGTYAADFTATGAGTRTITATIGGQPVTSTAPTVTVTAAAGPADPAQSTVAASPTTIPTTGTSTVTLTAKDAGGTALATGGAAVTFALGAGATATGSFGTVSDNGDGTYTAVFTPTGAGSAPIAATIGGQAVTTTLPTITVTSGPSGTADPAQSTMAASPATIPTTGTSTVTLTAKDAGGTPLTAGGAAVAFTLAAGSAGGIFGAVTDVGDGTYRATFTPSAAGTNTVNATIGGQAVTTTAPTITVTAPSGTADPAKSRVTLSQALIGNGGTATVTLTARDSTGTPLTTGGSVVTFGLGSGNATGTFDTVTDVGNGTYTAAFTATGSGTNTITATIDGKPVTFPAPTITVT